MIENQTERRAERTAAEARGGVIGHNVRYLMGAIIFFAGLLYYWAA
jgi:hypothetical protein